MSKKVTELTNEELIDRLKDPLLKEENKDDFERNVFGFIVYFNFKNGENPVNKRFLYELYKAWSGQKLQYRTFLSRFGFYFEATRKGFLLDTTTLDIKKSTLKYFNKYNKYLRHENLQKHFNNFIQIHKIKSGKQNIPFVAIFFLYEKWIYETERRKSFRYVELQNFMKLHFESKVTMGNVHWFCLNESLYEVFPKDKIIEYYESRKTEIKKEKKPIPQSRTPLKS